MSSLAETVIAVIAAALEGTPYGDMVEDRYFDTPLLRKGPNATPEAFDEAGIPQISIVVLDMPLNTNVAALGVPDAAEATAIIWFYGPDTRADRDSLRQLKNAVYSVMADEDVVIATDSEHIGFPLWAGDLEVRRNHEEFQASVIANTRFVIVHQRERIAL